MDKADCVPLGHLLNAPKKQYVVYIFQEAFRYRHTTVPSSVLQSVAEALKIDEDDAAELFRSCKKVVAEALFENLGPVQVADLFPKKFHKDLRELIAAVVSDGLPKFREEATLGMVSLPKLESFDWRVDIKSSADAIARMAQPSAIVDMKVREAATSSEQLAGVRSVRFELNRETLDTMLDGLTKIRDQMASVAE